MIPHSQVSRKKRKTAVVAKAQAKGFDEELKQSGGVDIVAVPGKIPLGFS